MVDTCDRPEHMLALLAGLKEEYGSVEEYCRKQCGLDEETIEAIRQRLVVPP
jgi:hypothetical protein